MLYGNDFIHAAILQFDGCHGLRARSIVMVRRVVLAMDRLAGGMNVIGFNVIIPYCGCGFCNFELNLIYALIFPQFSLLLP